MGSESKSHGLADQYNVKVTTAQKKPLSTSVAAIRAFCSGLWC